MTKSYLGSINIFIKDRHNLSAHVNQILTKEGRLIMARLGVNVEPKCISGCLAIICLAVCGPKQDLSGLTSQLNKLKGVEAKLNIMK